MQKPHSITEYLQKIAMEIGSRRAGTKACRNTEDFIRSVFTECGYEMDFFLIPIIDWEAEQAEIRCDNMVIPGFANIYSPSGIGEGEALVLRHVRDLEQMDISGRVCIFTGELTEDVLRLGDTPFQSERDEEVQSLLDHHIPAAIITINPRVNSVLPYLEKYTDAPTLTVAQNYEEAVVQLEGKHVQVCVSSTAESGVTGNVIAKTRDAQKKIVISAHYDTAEGSPGAWDNGSGVSALMELAKRFQQSDLNIQIEFAAMCPHEIGYPGSLLYTDSVQAELEKVILNINLDGIGAVESADAVTSENLPDRMSRLMHKLLEKYDEILDEGSITVEGDHFAYSWNDIPSMLFTSADHVGMHHENYDDICNVDIDKISLIVDFIEEFICELSADI